MPWTTAAIRNSPRTTLLVLHSLQTIAAAAAPSCPAFAVGACGPKRTCYDFPHIRQMAGGPFQVKNSNAVPEAVQYIVASPCQIVDPAAVLHPPRPCPNSTCHCTAFAGGQRTDCPAFIFAGTTCYALGNVTKRATVSLLDLTNASAGLLLYHPGGAVGHGCSGPGRGVQFRMVCDLSADPAAGPAGPVVPHQPGYCDTAITWHHPAACLPVPVACPPCPPPPPPLDQRPHLVFILTDDLGWNDIGFHDARVMTPTLDQLAAEGVMLERHYVYRYCSPTRSSLLSGRLPYHDHQTNGGLFGSRFGTNLNMTLLPAKLQRAGYRTVMRGKWHCGFSRPEYMPSARGFEDFAGNLMGGCDHFTQSDPPYSNVDSWRSNSSYEGPDRRNGTGYETYRSASDICSIIRDEDTRPLFLFASLLVVHEPLQAPAELIAQYESAQPSWCPKKHIIAAMSSTADNFTAQIVGALKQQRMWNNSVLVFASDNGGDTFASSNYPLRGRKRSFFEGGVRTPAFLASPLLPLNRRGRSETTIIHISDWYTTFLFLAKTDAGDSGPGRFAVDGRNLWPYLSSSSSTTAAVGAPPPAFAHNNTIVLGFNYSSMCSSYSTVTPAEHCRPDGYTSGSGALIEAATGFKLIVGSQNVAGDTMQWDPPNYPCNKTAEGPDCDPFCLYNVLDDPSERHELSKSTHAAGTGGGKNKDAVAALARLLQVYKDIGIEQQNPDDVRWNEQGKPWDPLALSYAREMGGYWRPWVSGAGGSYA